MSLPVLKQLESSLQDKHAPLDGRFRSLFALKGVATSSSEQTKAVIDIIAKAFEDNDSALLKHELAYVLGQIQSEDAIECLEKVLRMEAEHPMVRHEAAEALGAISSMKALPILRHYLNDDNVSVRETCDLAIKKIEYDHGPSTSSLASSNGEKEESEGSALARAKAVTSHNSIDEEEDNDEAVDSAFLPIDPAPAHSHQMQTLLSSIPLYEAQLTAKDNLPLFDRYRAMFSLRNAVHAARRKSQSPRLTISQRKEYKELALKAILALANGLTDKSALFRHEICFVFGELAHPGCVVSMIKVLSDDTEEEMVRHEAAEALGAVVEEASESESANEGKEVQIVLKTLQKWAQDEKAPRVVRESCIVALDEMTYNNDPTQFQPVPVATA